MYIQENKNFVINLSKPNPTTTMASYIEKFLGFSAWMSNPNPNPNPNTSTSKTRRIFGYPANTMRTPGLPVTSEIATQVQVSTPKSKLKPISISTSTIETQTIDNPELLAHTTEEMVGHYTQEIFQSQSSDITAPAPAAASADTTYTCCVCLDTLTLGDTNTTFTTCGHAYHLSCLLSSLRNKNSCPMCRGSLEDPRPASTTSNVLRPVNAEQIIREELYWFPRRAYIQNIRGSNNPKRAFKEAARTFGYAVLQSAAEFVHADNIPEEWYSGDDTDSESDNESENTDNENTDNENTDNENTDNESENTNTYSESDDETPRNQQHDEDEFNYAEQLRIQALNEERTRGANLFANANAQEAQEAQQAQQAQQSNSRRFNLRVRAPNDRRSNFDLRDTLP